MFSLPKILSSCEEKVSDPFVSIASHNDVPISSSPRSIHSGYNGSPTRYRRSSLDSDSEVTARSCPTISCAFNPMDPDPRERSLDVNIVLYLYRTRQGSVLLPRHFPTHGGINCNRFPHSGTADPARAQIDPEHATSTTSCWREIALLEGSTGPTVSLSTGIAPPLHLPFV